MSEVSLRLDVELLSRGAAADVAAYIRQQIDLHTETVISKHLLRLIKIEAIPPDVSSIWLSIVKNPLTLLHALQQNRSIQLRCSAIKRFAAWMRGIRWKEAWEAVGDAKGITQLLAEFSVNQVRMLTRAIGKNIRGVHTQAKAEKRKAVTQLLLLLVPTLQPGSADTTTTTTTTATIEKRDLVHLYAVLLPACTPDLVRSVLFGSQQMMQLRGNQRHLLREHHQVFLDAASLSPLPKSNWVDQPKHSPAVLMAVTLAHSNHQHASKLDTFLSQTIELILSESSKRTTQSPGFKGYKRARLVGRKEKKDVLERLIQHKSLDNATRKRIFDILLDTLAKHTAQTLRLKHGLCQQAAFDMVRFAIDQDADAEERYMVAAAAIEDFKNKSMRNSDPSDRQTLAQCALNWAVCSKSLDLYISTVVWLRRYVRDVTVARFIFSEASIQTREAIQLLSGIPQRLDASLSSQEIRQSICHANEAVWEWFETLCRSALGPSYVITDAAGARSLIRTVVIERMHRVESLQALLKLSVDSISSLVWDDTVKLLIRMEEKCIDPVYRRLHLYDYEGPLAAQITQEVLASEGVKIRSTISLSFVEKHFVARDALWRLHRSLVRPEVARLPPGLPKGLPLHYAPGIWNLDFILPRAPDCFFLSRARVIVFADPAVVLQPLPVGIDIAHSVGACHEDWEFSLLLLLKGQRNKEDRYKLMKDACEYLTTALSDPSWSRAEAENFWDHFVVLLRSKSAMQDRQSSTP
ncbi:hypothetical protein NDA16_002277 [Ustilago loliicola]|nr:hypothetical protein NDA16_002277 [Ustilago loliicola]